MLTQIKKYKTVGTTLTEKKMWFHMNESMFFMQKDLNSYFLRILSTIIILNVVDIMYFCYGARNV